jgi:hypothetical protein
MPEMNCQTSASRDPRMMNKSLLGTILRWSEQEYRQAGLYD